MSSVVTRLLEISITLMIDAASVSSLPVLRMRHAGCRGSSVAQPLINGMTTTPVSNPDRPSASRGKRKIAVSAMATGLLYSS